MTMTHRSGPRRRPSRERSSICPPPQGTKALNIGCGTTVAPGWLNLDNSPNARLSKIPGARVLLNRVGLLSNSHLAVEWPKDLIVRGAGRTLPFRDGEIDFVYSSHLVEHLSRTDAARLLSNVLRVLKPGGVVRIVVPDLAAQARSYLSRLEANPLDALAAPAFLNGIQLSKPGHRDPHLWMYDEPSLIALLEEGGFADVTLCPPGKGRTPDLDLLDIRPEGSLHVEASKGTDAATRR